MNRERLAILEEYLRDLDSTKFQIDQWQKGQEGCGMVCCAGGWACHIPEFQEAGLKISPADDHGLAPTLVKAGRVLEGYDALAEFFGVSRFLAEALFAPNFYTRNPNTGKVELQQVCERIFTLLVSPEYK